MSELPDGVYLSLDAPTYFAQDRMGSSDWIKLHQLKHGWWWQSRWNPDRVDKPSVERTYGSALHAIMLEGIAAYESRFSVEPDPRDFDGLVTSISEIQAALQKADRSLDGTSKWKRADWNAAMFNALPDVPCWDNIMEDFRARIGRREIVTSLEDRMLRFMRHVAVDPSREDNAAIRKLLTESELHPALAEVTVFSTIDGLRRRWRIDKMMPGVDIDLKSIGQWRGRPLKFEVGQVLAQNCWDIQRADYAIGRAEAYELIADDQLFGGTLEQRSYIREIIEEQPTWDWLWLAYGKPDPAGRAPILMPVWDKSGSSLHAYGRHKLAKAIAFYLAQVERFGLVEPWANVEPLHYTEDGHETSISLPHWIHEDEPVEEAAYVAG